MEEHEIGFVSSQRNRYEASNDSENFHPEEDISSVSPSPMSLAFLDSRYKSSPHSDQESDCSGSDYVSKQKQRMPSTGRRLSLHRDVLLHRKLNRAGSEKRKMSDKCSRPQTLFASLDCGQLKPKNLHLGHSAPNISYFFVLDKARKASCFKSGSSSFSASQTSTKKSRPLDLASPRVSLIKSRRISMNSLLSSDWSSFPSPSSAFSSKYSSQEAVDQTSEADSLWEESTEHKSFVSPSSPFRQRAQSFNLKHLEPDSNLNALNEFYRNCFPEAIAEMELKLEKFLRKCKRPDFYLAVKSDGSASFILHQLVELAGDCLDKSRAQQISSGYFSELVCNMQQLIENAKSKLVFHCNDLALMVRELLMIISRPARLLECLEFDPKDFYKKLRQGDLKQIHNEDVITYILKKLSLDKNSDKEARNDNDSSDTSSNASTKEVLGSSAPKELRLTSTDDVADGGTTTFPSPPQEADFETVKLISNGAYGAVLLVRHKETRKLFAMKKLLKSDLVLRNMIEQVFAERDILTFTDNPFVVSFYCSFETKKHLCMVLEYVEGGDCGALLKNIGGPLPLDMSRLYFAETVLALEYLHSFGIVHRDLKPDNLLLTSTGHVKLTDFGLSKIGLMKMTTNLFEGTSRDLGQFLDNQVFGTPEYIAPEVILRQGYGQTVDWWSMGVILYQFLVGCVPFTGETTEEVFSEIVSGEILWPQEEDFRVSDEAQDIILSMLEREPVNRLGFAGALEVKEHTFFKDVDWSGLLRQKTQFVPQLTDEEDTSYFDVRLDRYCHCLDDSGGEDGEKNDLFRSFSTCSPRYSRTEVTIFGDRYQEAEMKLPNIEVEHDWLDAQQPEADESFSPCAVDGSPLESNKTLPNRSDNKSCSSLLERCLQMETEQISRRGKGLRPSGSLKRYRENRVNKSSSSASLCNSTPLRNKLPHRLSRQFSRESSGSSFDDSFQESLPKVIQVARGRGGFGFGFRALKVLNEATGKYSLEHVVVHVERNGPAHKAGLCIGDVLTHVDSNRISGWPHRQVIKLLLKELPQSPPINKKKSGLYPKSSKSNSLSDDSSFDSLKHSGSDGKEPLKCSKNLKTKNEDSQNSKEVGKFRVVQRSRSLKLKMMNVLKKYGKAEGRSVWYASGHSNEADVPARASCVEENPTSGEVSPISVELRVVPTIKVKKTIKPTKKMSAILLKKRNTMEVLMMPKSFLTFQEKSMSRRTKYSPMNPCSNVMPVKKCYECLSSPSSPYHSVRGKDSASRPSTLVWGSRKESIGASVISPLVLCPPTGKSATEISDASQRLACCSSELVRSNLSSDTIVCLPPHGADLLCCDESKPQFFIEGPNRGPLENSESLTPTKPLE